MSARIAAAELIVAVLDGRRSLDDALIDTKAFADLAGRDRAFARALASASLRRLGSLNSVLSSFLQRPLPDSAPLARALLLVGAAQLLVLGTPAHAAVGETVEAATSRRETRGFAKLMNAVLRRVSREGAALFDAADPGADLPAWLYTRWRATYGDEAARIAEALRHEAPLDLSVVDDADEWAQRLGGALTPTGSVRLSETSPVETLQGFADGAWWVQDAAAALPARLLYDVRGKRVLDLCAAPGGKTLQLAATGAVVTAVDKSESRLARVRDNLKRMGLTAKVVCADALSYRDEPFDAVLLDAPCTATGTVRRHPDVTWLRRPTDVGALSKLQGQMIDAAAALLKPGAPLVYAVCSLEPEEGEGVVAQALARGWRREPLKTGEIAGADAFITPAGDLRTLPSRWPESGGLDGFFAARVVRP